MLTKNKRTHILILKDFREFNITKDQYSTLYFIKQDKKQNEMFLLKDCDTDEILFNGEVGMIKEFRERKKISNTGIKYICDYGKGHGPQEKCDCYNFFNCPYWIFYDFLEEKGYKYKDVSDIKESWQMDYINTYRDNKKHYITDKTKEFIKIAKTIYPRQENYY